MSIEPAFFDPPCTASHPDKNAVIHADAEEVHRTDDYDDVMYRCLNREKTWWEEGIDS